VTALLAPRRLNRIAREPNNLPAYPQFVLAGLPKTGKSYAAAEATNSELIGQTFWLEIGEDSADEYGSLGRYRIVDHDGSYEDILDSVRWAVAQPRVPDGRPNLIVLDSVTVLWDLLVDEQTLVARERAEKRGVRVVSDQDLTITSDQWNRAKDRWRAVLNTLRYHDGPVIMISRLEEVTVFDGDKPTRFRQWKVKAEKNLSYEATAVVQLRAYGSAFLTDVRSLNPELAPFITKALPDFTVDGVFRMLGMERRVRSSYVMPRPEAYLAELAQADEQARPADQRPPQAPVEQPLSGLLNQLIRAAYKTGREEALVAIRLQFSVTELERVMVPGKAGPVSANAAIDSALALLQKAGTGEAGQTGCTVPECSTPHDDVRPYANGAKCTQHAEASEERAAGEAAAAQAALAAEASQEESAPETPKGADPGSDPDPVARGEDPGGATAEDGEESQPDCVACEEQDSEDNRPVLGAGDVDPWSTTTQSSPAASAPTAPESAPATVPAKMLTGRERVRAMMLEEAMVQAQALRVTVTAHLNLPPGGQLDLLPPAKLKGQLLACRPRVIAALREQGRASAADVYAKFGDLCPAPNLARLMEEPDGRAL